jgi:CubicO group peptidase (beta-lactamase class C family)
MQLRPGEPEKVGMSARRVRHVGQLAAGWVAQGITSALVILVARRGVVVLHEAFGRLTPDDDAPRVTRDTLYPLSSLTKPITATAAMLLVEDGLLGLQRPVSEYLPEFSGAGKQAVMVHHLLTHTSGLRGEDVIAHAAKKRGVVAIPPSEETQHPWINEYLFLGYDVPLWQPPGVEMSYCNYNYNLLGEIVRRVSGQALADFARARLFEPLGMQDTFYIVPDAVRARVVRRPLDAPWATTVATGAPGLGTQENQQLPLASGGVYSTAMDMAIFGQMFLNRGSYGEVSILSPAAVAEMTRNQIPGIGAQYAGEFFPEASWGFGWSIHGNKRAPQWGSLYSPQAFDHNGAGGTYVWVDPVYEIVGVYFQVTLERIDDIREKLCRDLFMNAVMAAVVDA